MAAAHQLNTPSNDRTWKINPPTASTSLINKQQQSPPGLSSSSFVSVPEASNSISDSVLLNSTKFYPLTPTRPPIVPNFPNNCLSRFGPFGRLQIQLFYAAAPQMSCCSSWLIDIAALVTEYFIWPHLKITNCTLCRH